ncbi:hypothetical protein RHA1_ro10454 (plasmid) [Rhodococcus jostii RHA1]|uniref:Uncharacterized protein n=1 Tax=Rhodococcus jostii (strain RHA1) TaxID=101510 RepID=Q0RVP3_RHOJR|nr:hypothetical protein RHA1_ro10454 [Rhodococcus jostii RHA1]
MAPTSKARPTPHPPRQEGQRHHRLNTRVRMARLQGTRPYGTFADATSPAAIASRRAARSSDAGIAEIASGTTPRRTWIASMSVSITESSAGPTIPHRSGRHPH